MMGQTVEVVVYISAGKCDTFVARIWLETRDRLKADCFHKAARCYGVGEGVKDSVVADVVVTTEELDRYIWVNGADGMMNSFEFLGTESNVANDEDEIDVCCCYCGPKPGVFDCFLDGCNNGVFIIAGEVEDKAKGQDSESILGDKSLIPRR